MMSAAGPIKGWCPDRDTPDGKRRRLVTRLAPVAGFYSAASLHAAALLAERHGNGIIELTLRRICNCVA